MFKLLSLECLLLTSPYWPLLMLESSPPSEPANWNKRCPWKMLFSSHFHCSCEVLSCFFYERTSCTIFLLKKLVLYEIWRTFSLSKVAFSLNVKQLIICKPIYIKSIPLYPGIIVVDIKTKNRFVTKNPQSPTTWSPQHHPTYSLESQNRIFQYHQAIPLRKTPFANKDKADRKCMQTLKFRFSVQTSNNSRRDFPFEAEQLVNVSR